MGEEQVQRLTLANMGGEDFSYYMEEVPGCYIRYGAQVPGRENFPAHSSKFDFDEKAMACGAGWMYEVSKVAGRALVELKQRT